MNPQRVLVVHEAGPVRSALARALASAGHDVQVADTGGETRDDAAFDAVVFDESHSTAVTHGGQRIAVRRPVNMEELRHALRVV